MCSSATKRNFLTDLFDTQGLLQKTSEKVSLNNKTIRFKTLTNRSKEIQAHKVSLYMEARQSKISKVWFQEGIEIQARNERARRGMETANDSSTRKPRISLSCSSVQDLQIWAFSLQLQSGSEEEHGVSFHTGYRALHKPKSYLTSAQAVLKVYKPKV